MTFEEHLATLVKQAVTEALSALPAPAAHDGDSTVLTVQELGEYLRIGKSAAYALVNAPACPFKVTRIGNRILVPRWQVRAWLDQGGQISPDPRDPPTALSFIRPTPTHPAPRARDEQPAASRAG